MLIYKIFRPAEWTQLQTGGETPGSPVDIADGFVHFSTASQVPETLAKHFSAEGQLILLACDAEAVAADLRWEPARGGTLFAHLYRPLRMVDVLWTREITRRNGAHDAGELE